MYGDASIHRIAVCVGCVGLAALMPYGVLSMWLAILLAVLPLAVLELGAALVDRGEKKSSNRALLYGWHLQAYGALLFLTPFAVFAASLLRQRPPYWLHFLIITSVAVPSCILIVFRWRHVLLGRRPHTRKEASEVDADRPGALRRLAIIGAEPFLFGGVALLVVSLVVFGILRGVVTSSGELLLAVGLLASVALMAVAASLDRWEERAPGTSLGPAQDALQTLAAIGITSSFLAGGLLWTGATWLRFTLITLGGLCLASVIFIGARRARGRPGRYQLCPFKEGLLERSRHGAILYPWTAVLSCSQGEVGGLPCVLLHMDDTDSTVWTVVWARRGLKPNDLIEMRRGAMGSNRQWLGVDVFALRDHLEVSLETFEHRVTAIIEAKEGARDELRSISEVKQHAPLTEHAEA